MYICGGAIIGAVTLAACGPPSPPGPPGGPTVVVEGPAYALDTVVVRGAGCDPTQAAGVRLVVWPAGTQSYTELGAMGSPMAAVQPNGSVSATFNVPVLTPGAYRASLVCTPSLETNPTTDFSVAAGPAPQATVAVTSPAPPGGSAVLTAQHCGRSANGEVQALIRIVGPGSNFSFHGTTRADGSIEQAFSVPANAAAGSYAVEMNCGRNPSQTVTGRMVIG